MSRLVAAAARSELGQGLAMRRKRRSIVQCILCWTVSPFHFEQFSTMMVTQQRKVLVEAGATDLPPETNPGIAELARADDYARDLRCDPWQFAVEISRLTDLGLTTNDLRWLVEKGFATHAREVTGPDDGLRRFEAVRNTAFTKETCFLLTDSGLSFAGVVCSGPTLLVVARCAAALQTDAVKLPAPLSSCQAPPPCQSTPATCRTGTTPTAPCTWASRSSSASGTARRIKRSSSRPSRKRGGPGASTTRCRRRPNVVPKRRLHDTIKWLNRHQEIRRLNFFGDGTGEGVRREVMVAGTLAISPYVRKRQRLAA